jgi:hypothetical protein
MNFYVSSVVINLFVLQIVSWDIGKLKEELKEEERIEGCDMMQDR